MYIPPTLAVLVSDVGPVSASFSAITAIVAAWIAAYMIAVWIASDSAISICILYNSLSIFCTTYICPVETFYSSDHVMLLTLDVIKLM